MTGCSTTSTTSDEPSTPASKIAIPSENGPGVTDSQIVVMDMTRGQDPALDKYADALVATMNGEGGIAGRQVKLIATPKLPQPANATAEQVVQAQCAAFASGPEFFVLLGSGYRCLTTEGMVGINDITLTRLDAEAAPYMLAPANMTDVRAAATLAMRLREDGQLDGVEKVGVVTLAGDTYANPEAAQTLVDDLEADSPDYAVETFEASGTTQADVLSLVVKLKQAGVDFVVPGTFFGSGAIDVATFAAQKYYPGISGYGIYIPPGVVGTLPESFLGGISQYGWRLNDYTVPAGQGQQLSTQQPAAAECLDVAKQARVSTAGGLLGAMLAFCDDLRFLKASLEGSGSDYVNAEAFLVGARKVGPFDCVQAFACEITADRFDGATAVRRIGYDAGEKAFVYQGDNLPTAP
ncbi:hypothetical protein GCM10027062_26300 [Nocardioides hungaricus]